MSDPVITMLDIAAITPYEGNPRHNDDAVDPVARSIEEYGFKIPMVVSSDGTIVTGHTRYKAAKKLGMTKVPVIIADDLTDEQIRAFRIVDNKVGEIATWDDDLLQFEIDAIDIDLGDFGFDTLDLFDDEPDEPQEIDVPDDVETRVKPGEVWVLGGHRLMCGDATSASDLKKLTGGGRVDACFTSPPYNMAQNGGYEFAQTRAMGAGRAYATYTDDLSDEDYSALLCDALGNALTVCDDVMFNLGILAGSKIGIAQMIAKYQDNFGEILVWNKSHGFTSGLPSHKGIVSHKCEMVFCFNAEGKRSFSHPQWSLGSMTNCIETELNSANALASEHHAAFPVAFPFAVIKNFTEESVLDPFGGTGTTLIAAEQLDRVCYMLEIDPHYCDVIIERWEQLTGKTAKRERSRR